MSNIPQAVREVLVRDDDDFDLKNKTPHFFEIQRAAKTHGLDRYLDIK